ncbi:MAG: hypothetical protein PHO02_02195 [Candidatus Nanoarchaeia archaeon]|nr:hypothetical protein [Candidatus Nanoarchaeia archaeon]
MGKVKHLPGVEALFSKSPVVRFDSIQKIVSGRKNKKQYAKRLIKNLIAKGKIKKLAKGWYTAKDDTLLSVFCFQPAYFGLQDALSFHGLTEQETIPVIVTTQRVKQGIRQIMGSNVLVRRIKKDYFFGFESNEQSGMYLPYSDIEKTVIDMAYFKESLSPEAFRDVLRICNLKKIEAYLKKYPEKMQKIIKGRMRNWEPLFRSA